MTTIWKYDVVMTDTFTHDMPKGAMTDFDRMEEKRMQIKAGRIGLIVVWLVVLSVIVFACISTAEAAAPTVPTWDDPYWTELNCIGVKAYWDEEDRTEPYIWLEFPGNAWFWVNGSETAETHTFSYRTDGTFWIVRPLKPGDTVVVEGLLYTSPHSYTGHLSRTTFTCVQPEIQIFIPLVTR